MRGSAPQTTITLPRGTPSQSGSSGLCLMWLFPRPSDPELSLDFAADEERIVGRDAACALHLSGTDISRRHARFHRDGPHLLLSDLGSRNGTFVNGEPAKSTRVGNADVVRLGGSIALVTDRPGLPSEIGPGEPGLLAGPLLQAELEPAKRAAASDLPVILEGETGTGKEVVARAIHAWSRRSGPFVAVNCATLPEPLAEGELFGYRRGAFTGAERASPGFFRNAQGGTLLLDEVSDLPLAVQAKLLRALEAREVQPLGEAAPVAVDARIIVATQEPLGRAAEERRFRPDLLARLDGLTVRLSPLRKRPGDALALFLRVLTELGSGRAPGLEPDFVERLCMHDWPFNVREVVLLARRLHVLRDQGESLRARDLPERMLGSSKPAEHDAKVEQAGRSAPEPLELPALIAALRTAQGNVAQAAAVLGISRQRAYRLMQEHAVDLDALRSESERQD